MQVPSKFLISILGPTAVGKTTMAIKVAQVFNTHIISADSRQFYKEVSIGTAKPSVAELASVPHHFINTQSIANNYTAGDFSRDANQLMKNLFNTYNSLVLCGGSGLYIKALTEGIDNLPVANEKLRTELRQQFEMNGIGYLQQRLFELDAVALQHIDIQNPQRLMRAIEIAMGMSPTTDKAKSNTFFHHIPIGLDLPREELYQKINTRVDEMMQNGLLDEVRSILPYRHTYAMKTVGYTELFDYFDGVYPLQKAVELIKQHTRNYAKKQLTWFRKTNGIKWFHPSDYDGVCEYVKSRMLPENNT
jgi:tRNA dimethylallyltransferase